MPNPIQGAKVEIYKGTQLVDERYTNSDGECDFYLPRDTYTVRVSKEGYYTHEQLLALLNDYIKNVYLQKVTAKRIETIIAPLFSDNVTVTERGVSRQILTSIAPLFSDSIVVSQRPVKQIPTSISPLFEDSVVVTERIVKQISTSIAPLFSDEQTISEYIGNASNLDPNDPTWKNVDEYSNLWEFKSNSELNDFEHKNVTVEQDMARMDGSVNQCHLMRNLPDYITKAVICLKMQFVEYVGIIANLRIVLRKLDNYGFVLRIYFNEDGSLHVEIEDGDGTHSYDLDYNGDWIVVDCYVNESSYVKIYDKNKNLLLQHNVTNLTDTSIYGAIIRVATNDEGESKAKIDIDWIADVEPQPSNASGLDPNDPTWAPSEGWTKIWEFNTQDELDDFANITKMSVIQEDSYITSPSDSCPWSEARRQQGNVKLKRVAVCLYVPSTPLLCEPDWLYAYPLDFVSNSFNAYVDSTKKFANGKLQDKYLSDNVTRKFRLEAGNNNTEIDPVLDEWLVFLVIFDDATQTVTARLYNKNKNVICEITGAYSSSTIETLYSETIIHFSNSMWNNRGKIDWVAWEYV